MIENFADRINALSPQLLSYANFLTRCPSESEDLVQDTLVRAWRYRAGFQSGTNLRRWLFKIMRNEFLSNLNKTRRWGVHLSQAMGYELTQEPEQEWGSLFGDLMRALDNLSDSSREALLLVSACGYSYEQTADLCDCAVGTIKSRVSRARDRVARLLRQDGMDGRAARHELLAPAVAGAPLAMQRHH